MLALCEGASPDVIIPQIGEKFHLYEDTLGRPLGLDPRGMFQRGSCISGTHWHLALVALEPFVIAPLAAVAHELDLGMR